MPADRSEVKWSDQLSLCVGELRLHGLGERVHALHRAHHDRERTDRTILVELDEVASLDLLVADPGLKRERVIMGAVGADLAHIAEVFEHRQDGFQDRARAKLATYDRLLADMLDGRDEETFERDSQRIGPYLTLMGGRMYEQTNIRWCTAALEVLSSRLRS